MNASNNAKCDPKHIKSSGSLRDVDEYVGNRLKNCRMNLGLSLGELALALDVKVPVIQKYEDGSESISSGKLYLLAHFMGMPVRYFWDDMSLQLENEEAQVIEAYNALHDPRIKEQVLNILQTISS